MPKHEPPRASRPTTAPPSREEPARAETPRAPEPALAESETGGPVLAAPATRKLARELGVDLGQVSGSGPRGRVTQEDVRSFAESRRSAPRSPSPSAPRRESDVPPPTVVGRSSAPQPSYQPSAGGPLEERIPLRGVRKRIAEAMHLSKSTAAHFTYVDEVDVTDLVNLRQGARAIGEQRGVKVTYLPFIMKAILSALREYPMLNATMDDQRGEIVVKRYYNFGIAVDTDSGLIVPVVKDVDKKSILRIAQDVQELADRARQGKSRLEDLQGGTFTITNAGNIGGLFATPVINYPEVAILGVHKIAKRPVVKDGAIVVRDIMYLSISLDHRVVDGAVGARFMNHVIQFLEDPKLLLLESI
jgi:pyruvate dehydrogenase E2 component (dihydrolipoamide acetyltransferase)